MISFKINYLKNPHTNENLSVLSAERMKAKWSYFLNTETCM